MKKLLFALATLCALFALKGISASADYVPQIDTTGKITGTVNQTYYDVSSWSDMYSAYKDSDEDTVYLNVTQDISGSAANGYEKGAEVEEGKSLTILGNNHKLYFGLYDDPTRTYTVDSDSAYKHYGFYSVSSSVTSRTTLRLENATWINSITYGMFQINWNASATTQYHNVTEMNGGTGSGSTPLINRLGNIEFSGTNVFNVTGDSMRNVGPGKHDTSSIGSVNSSLATDQAGWIHGNRIYVKDGSTTLNMNSKYSSPIYHFNNYGSVTPDLEVYTNSKLIWNIDNSSNIEDDSVGDPSAHNYTIDDGASFLINGSVNTARSKWFNTAANTSFKIKNKASFVATTGNALNLPVNSGTSSMNIGDQGNVSITNVWDTATRYTISGNFYRGNVHLANNSHLLIRAKNRFIFQNYYNYFFLDGSGLTGKFSKQFDGSGAVTQGATTGKIGIKLLGIDDELDDPYSDAAETVLNSQPSYIEFGQEPTILTFTGSLDRLYSLTSSDLPQNSTATTGLISGQSNMWFNINSNNPNPSVYVTLKMQRNYQDGIVSYFWKKNQSSDSDNKDDPAEITGKSTKIWSSSGKTTTPDSNGNGYNYYVNYDNGHGLMMKTTNALKAGTEYDGAIFDYTFTSGPD